MRLGLMLSGELGTKLLNHLLKRYKISAILTDSNSNSIIEQAKNQGIPIYVGNPRKNDVHPFIKDIPIDLLLSINYLFIVYQNVIDWPKQGAVNFHGSLLPKYRGRTPHVWAIINNETKTGVTAHFITSGCDEGDIIQQIITPIEDDDTGASLLKKFEDVYSRLVDEVISKFNVGKVEATPQLDVKATKFGKRTPEDGHIKWDWYRERIRNWIRAQAYPYPGAFTYLQNQKIIIDEAVFDDFGFIQEHPNGLILSTDPVRIKTPNGALRLTKIREGESYISQNAIVT